MQQLKLELFLVISLDSGAKINTHFRVYDVKSYYSAVQSVRAGFFGNFSKGRFSLEGKLYPPSEEEIHFDMKAPLLVKRDANVAGQVRVVWGVNQDVLGYLYSGKVV